MENPYQSPGAVLEVREKRSASLDDVASGQKLVIYAILLYFFAAALHYLAERERVHEALRREGVNVLDVRCSELSGALIERYLAIKRGNRL